MDQSLRAWRSILRDVVWNSLMATSYSYVVFLIASVWIATGNTPETSMGHLTVMLLVHAAATTIYVLKHKHDIATFAKPTATILAMSTVILYVVSPSLHSCDVIKAMSIFLFALLTSTVYITAPIARTVCRLLELQEYALKHHFERFQDQSSQATRRTSTCSRGLASSRASTPPRSRSPLGTDSEAVSAWLDHRFEHGFQDPGSQSTMSTGAWSSGLASTRASTPPRSPSPLGIDPEAVLAWTKHADQVYEPDSYPAEGSQSSLRLSTYSTSPRSSIMAYLGRTESSRGSSIPTRPAPRYGEPFAARLWRSELSLLDLNARYPRRC